ncbi:MAG: hypothetical protein IKU98_08545, partial [Bacteroidaceae bacterium]|nr:hypothetical protein [Bacteroidaceae bacterium]
RVHKVKRKSEPFTLHNIKEEREKAVDTDDRYFMSYRIDSYINDRYAIHEEILWSFHTGSTQSEYQEYVTEYDFGVGKTIKDVGIQYVDYIQVYSNNFSHRRTKWANSSILVDNIGARKHICCWIYRKPKPIKGLRTTHFDGYSEVIDYYHPQYNREIIPGEVDYRRTLYWNPYLELDNEGKSTITFYNNDTYTQPIIKIESLGDLIEK